MPDQEQIEIKIWGKDLIFKSKEKEIEALATLKNLTPHNESIRKIYLEWKDKSYQHNFSFWTTQVFNGETYGCFITPVKLIKDCGFKEGLIRFINVDIPLEQLPDNVNLVLEGVRLGVIKTPIKLVPTISYGEMLQIQEQQQEKEKKNKVREKKIWLIVSGAIILLAIIVNLLPKDYFHNESASSNTSIAKRYKTWNDGYKEGFKIGVRGGYRCARYGLPYNPDGCLPSASESDDPEDFSRDAWRGFIEGFRKGYKQGYADFLSGK